VHHGLLRSFWNNPKDRNTNLPFAIRQLTIAMFHHWIIYIFFAARNGAMVGNTTVIFLVLDNI
jgi:hypothetical protein